MLTQQAPASSLDRVRARVAALNRAGAIGEEVHQRALLTGRANSDNAFSAYQQDLAVEAARKRAAAMAKAARVTAPGAGAVGGTSSGTAGEWGLESPFATALRRMMADAPGLITVTSGLRTRAQQAALYAKKPRLAAPPGKSRHEDLDHEPGAEAADIKFANDAVRAWAHANAAKYGLRFPMSYEPWHVEPARR